MWYYQALVWVLSAALAYVVGRLQESRMTVRNLDALDRQADNLEQAGRELSQAVTNHLAKDAATPPDSVLDLQPYADRLGSAASALRTIAASLDAGSQPPQPNGIQDPTVGAGSVEAASTVDPTT